MDGHDLLKNLESSDLKIFLRACPAYEVTVLAQSMAKAYGSRLTLDTLHVPRSLSVRGMRGYDLIADIKEDLSQLGSHAIGPKLNYRESVEWIAGRHGIKDAEKQAVVELERQILNKYDFDLIKNGEFSSFADKGSAGFLRKALWITPLGATLDYTLSANWGITTFITLKIAIMRTINRARALRATLED